MLVPLSQGTKAEPAAVVVDLSYGTTIFRYAVLTNETGLWQNGTLLEIAPVRSGVKICEMVRRLSVAEVISASAAPQSAALGDGVDGPGPAAAVSSGRRRTSLVSIAWSRADCLWYQSGMCICLRKRGTIGRPSWAGKIPRDGRYEAQSRPGAPTVIAQASQFPWQS